MSRIPGLRKIPPGFYSSYQEVGNSQQLFGFGWGGRQKGKTPEGQGFISKGVPAYPLEIEMAGDSRCLLQNPDTGSSDSTQSECPTLNPSLSFLSPQASSSSSPPNPPPWHIFIPLIFPTRLGENEGGSRFFLSVEGLLASEARRAWRQVYGLQLCLAMGSSSVWSSHPSALSLGSLLCNMRVPPLAKLL